MRLAYLRVSTSDDKQVMHLMTCVDLSGQKHTMYELSARLLSYSKQGAHIQRGWGINPHSREMQVFSTLSLIVIDVEERTQ